MAKSPTEPGLASRAAALDLLAAVLRDGRALDAALGESRRFLSLPTRDRAFAHLLVATILRRLGQIDAGLQACLAKPLPRKAATVHDVLRLGAVQLLFLATPPHAAVDTSVRLLEHSYAERSLDKSGGKPAVRCRLANWWDGDGVKAVSKELFADSEGSHATPSEVSLSYYAYPGSVKQAQMSPKVAPKGSFTDAYDYRRKFPDGRIGSDPSLASVEHGERLFKAAVQDVAANYTAFLKEAA